MYSLLLLLVPSAYAQIGVNKTCNFTDIVTSIDTTSTIAGTWHQIERIENTFDTGDCSTITFTAILSDKTITGLDITTREVVGGKLVFRNASFSFSADYTGVMNFTFDDGNSYDYVIIPVKSYEHEMLVLYSCQNNGNSSLVWAWKLGKHQSQSPEARNATENIITGIEELENVTWRTTSYGEAACKINSEGNLLTPSFIFIVFPVICGYLCK